MIIAVVLLVNALALAYLGWLVLMLYRDRQPKVAVPTPALEPDPSNLRPEEARAIDPDNPPYYSYYRPEVYDASRAPSCTCHGLKVIKGEKVLLWPIPNHPEGGMDVFCAETYKAIEEDE